VPPVFRPPVFARLNDAAARLRPSLLFAAAFIFAAPLPAAAVQVERSYEYYTISASSRKGLLEAFSRSGPALAKSGHRHAAATVLDFKENLQFQQSPGSCALAKVDINVIARIYLPRWEERDSAKDPRLIGFWDVMTDDMHEHEAKHIQIAVYYAQIIEQKARKLRPQRDCGRLTDKVHEIMTEISDENTVAQDNFDKSEAQRVKAWLANEAKQDALYREAEARLTRHTPRIPPKYVVSHEGDSTAAAAAGESAQTAEAKTEINAAAAPAGADAAGTDAAKPAAGKTTAQTARPEAKTDIPAGAAETAGKNH